jgi:PAS domain S-box-containing protein
MTAEPRNITPPDMATKERDHQTTEKSQAKPVESLRTSEIRYRRLFEAARDGILILNADSRRITDVNPYMVELLEYSREEFIGKELYEIGLLANEEASQKVYRELQESGYIRYDDLPLETKSGKRWEVEFVCNLYNEDGQQVIQCNIRDITARKRAEAAKTLLAAIVDSVDVSVVSIDFDRTITSWNPGAEALFGYTTAEAIGQPLEMLTLPEDLLQLLNNIERIEQSKTVETFKTVGVQKNGERLHLAITLSPVKGAAGHVIGVSTLARDISVQRQAEAALQRKTHELTDFCENAAVGLEWVGADGTVLWANHAALDLLGYTREEYIGRNITEFYDDPAVISDILQRSENRETLNGYEAQIRCKDGSLKDVQIASDALFQDGTFVHSRCLTLDITERKQVLAALRDSEAQFRLLADNAPDVISRYDRELRNIFISPAIERLVGISPAALQNKTLREMGMPEEVAVAWEANMRYVVETGQHVTFEFEFPGFDGGILLFESRSIPEFEEDGTVKTVLSIARDITERKRVEEALQAAKAEADRANRAKNEFLSRMSHELRTPMNAILGFAQLLEMDDLNTEQRQGVDQILKGGRHLMGLINEVLDVTRIDAGEMSISPEAVQLGIVAQEAWDLVGPLAATRNVEPLGDWEQACAHVVLADPQRLKQVLINLLSNAIKYNHEGGSVTLACRLSAKPEAGDRKVVTTGRRQGDTAGDALALASSGNDFVPTLRLDITDTGPGVAPENLEKIFIAFERLGAERSETEGTGIGLALSRRLMELMGGTIGVQSTLGQGSTFWIELPLVESPEMPLSGAEPDAAIASTGSVRYAPRTILYVDDNPSNLRLMERILMRQPHTKLVPVMLGRLGIELSRNHHPDLILLDLHLPDISGHEVLRRLRAEPETQGIPVVMLSGDATPRQIERLLQDGANAYLTKPLDIKRFLQVVEETLAKGNP